MIKRLIATAILFCTISITYKCLAQDVPLNPPAQKINDPANVLTTAQQMPHYPGGQDSLVSFLGRNIDYPAAAMQANLEGTVYIQFVVAADGSIRDIKILKDIGSGCGAEAARVVGLMPKWIPGRENGKAVAIQFTLPIRFTLAKG